MQPPHSRPGFLRALRHRNFRNFFEGQAISLVGTWVQNTALTWLVWRTTHSATQLALVSFASQIPNLVLAPVAGVLADRYSRHRMVIITQVLLMLQALGLAAYVLGGGSSYHLLVIFALFLGTVVSFDLPARQSLVVELAGKADLPNAIALNSLLFNGARAIGPAIAGPLLLHFTEGWFFLANGVSYILVIWLLIVMRLPERKIPARVGNVAQNLREAVSFVRRHSALRDMLIQVSFVSLFGIPYIVVLPAVAEHALGSTDPRGYSLLMASSGIGAVVGAFMLARGSVDARGARTIPLGGLAFSVALFIFTFSRHRWLSAVLLLPTGVTMMMQTVGSNTFIQHLVPDRFRGRVMSFYSMMFLGVLPLGSLMIGAMADHIGPLQSIRIGACVVMAASLVLLARAKRTEASIAELIQLEHEETAATAALEEAERAASAQLNG